MASYATVPATDLESEATLLNRKPKTKTSFLVGGVAAAAFVLGVLSMTALRTSPWTLGQCDAEYKEWVGCVVTTLFAQNQPDFNSVDCQIDCDAVIGTPSRP